MFNEFVEAEYMEGSSKTILLYTDKQGFRKNMKSYSAEHQIYASDRMNLSE